MTLRAIAQRERANRRIDSGRTTTGTVHSSVETDAESRPGRNIAHPYRTRGERASRHQEPWSSEEDAELEDVLGRMSTRAVALRMGRSVTSIWSRASYLGVSPYSGDGRYTASELARTLDLPVNTVLLWCEREYLRAQKMVDAAEVESGGSTGTGIAH